MTHALPIQEKCFDPKIFGSSASGFICRCWIRIIPEGPAHLSLADIYRLYKFHILFAAVISPKARGLKGLCVELTEESRSRIDEFAEDERRVGSSQERADEVVEMRILASTRTFYTHAPVTFVTLKCGNAVGHRSKEKNGQLIKDHVAKKGLATVINTIIIDYSISVKLSRE